AGGARRSRGGRRAGRADPRPEPGPVRDRGPPPHRLPRLQPRPRPARGPDPDPLPCRKTGRPVVGLPVLLAGRARRPPHHLAVAARRARQRRPRLPRRTSSAMTVAVSEKPWPPSGTSSPSRPPLLQAREPPVG